MHGAAADAARVVGLGTHGQLDHAVAVQIADRATPLPKRSSFARLGPPPLPCAIFSLRFTVPLAFKKST